MYRSPRCNHDYELNDDDDDDTHSSTRIFLVFVLVLQYRGDGYKSQRVFIVEVASLIVTSLFVSLLVRAYSIGVLRRMERGIEINLVFFFFPYSYKLVGKAAEMNGTAIDHLSNRTNYSEIWPPPNSPVTFEWISLASRLDHYRDMLVKASRESSPCVSRCIRVRVSIRSTPVYAVADESVTRFAHHCSWSGSLVPSVTHLVHCRSIQPCRIYSLCATVLFHLTIIRQYA